MEHRWTSPNSSGATLFLMKCAGAMARIDWSFGTEGCFQIFDILVKAIYIIALIQIGECPTDNMPKFAVSSSI